VELEGIYIKQQFFINIPVRRMRKRGFLPEQRKKIPLARGLPGEKREGRKKKMSLLITGFKIIN
jgi:hypothetical protein